MTPIGLERVQNARKITVKPGHVEVVLDGNVRADVTSTPKGGTVTEVRGDKTYANFYLDGSPSAEDNSQVEINGVIFRAEEGTEAQVKGRTETP